MSHMSIPIVQGTAVPQDQQQQQYGYIEASEAQMAIDPFTGPGPQQHEKQSAFQDVPWAILFIVHLIAMLVILTINIQGNGAAGNGGADYGGIIWMVSLTAAVGIALSCLSLSLIMKYPQALVKAALVVTIGLSFVMSIAGFLMGQVFMGCISMLMFLIGICYARAVWARIPFAAANLTTALTAVQSNMGLTFIAIMMMAPTLGWSLLWFVGFGDALATSNGGIIFLLLVSYYWVHQVLSNMVHVTSAGTVATWWYVPLEAASCCSRALQDSFSRAATYSFGSICFGSLIVAIVQSMRAMARMARQNDDMQILACILECLLSILQDIIEYFNQWAYVYVGIYGFSYLEAGKNVLQLFENKGWTVLITDNLCERVLLMVSLGIGLVTGLIGWLIAFADPNILAAMGDDNGTGVGGFMIGLMIGFIFSSILLSVVSSAVNTVIVCFAEAPNEFQANHPELSNNMRAAWSQAWPELTL